MGGGGGGWLEQLGIRLSQLPTKLKLNLKLKLSLAKRKEKVQGLLCKRWTKMHESISIMAGNVNKEITTVQDHPQHGLY